VNIRVVLRYGAAALVAAVVVLPLAASGAAAPKLDGLKQVSRDNIADGFALHRSVVQPTIAADGTKTTLVSAFEVGRIFDGGSSAIGFATSRDGGKGWKDDLLPLTIGGGVQTTGAGTVWRAADPSVAFDESHATWLVTATGLGSTGGSLGLFANSSQNADRWSDAAVVHAAALGDTPSNGSLACDDDAASKGYGTCYLAYTNTSSSPANQLQVVTSSDGGATWSAPAGTPDASTGTSPVTLVQPPRPGAAPGTECGRVVVAYTGGGGVSWIASTDCGATWSAHTQILPNFTSTHTVAQGLRTSLVVSGSTDAAGALYLAWQTRSFRIAQTTLSTAANAGDTNVKVASVTGMVVGNTLTIDAAGTPETVTITTVGTSGSGGTGITFTPALASAHAQGAIVTLNGVFSTSTAAPNDIALSVMPGPTDAAPEPGFGAPTRVAIEADAGALTNTVDHFIPAIAADPASSGATARLGLFYAFYPLAACQYVSTPDLQCSPRVGYVSSTDGGATWSDPDELSPGPPSDAVYPRTSGPDMGNVFAALVVAVGKNAGDAVGLFPVGIPVDGTDVSLYTPKDTLEIGGGS
jgi:hypothetical protein